MQMDRLTRDLTVLWRAERLIAQRRLAVVRRRTGALALAAMVALFGLALLDLAAFFALAPRIGPAAAALILGGANLALAGLAAAWAARQSVEDEIAPACEVRDMALEDLEAEARRAGDEIRGAVEDVRRLARDPLGALAPAALTPLIGAVLRALRAR